jgi:hypothetical protein
MTASRLSPGVRNLRPCCVSQTSILTEATGRINIDGGEPATAMHRFIMIAFSANVLRITRLPPMTVMSLAASALGAVYKEVADQHRSDGGCTCGWKPNLRADVEALQAALASRMQTVPAADLRVMQGVGHA